MAALLEDDPRMRKLAFEVLLERTDWFEWVRMKDTDAVVTMFLADWRDALYRHDTRGRTIWDWVKLWSEESKAKIRAKLPYLSD